MDVLLLGAMAIVLIALTLWIVWHPTSDRSDAIRPEESTTMTPMGDSFEDQYTSATADLSAGGVAVTTAGREEEPLPEPVSEVPQQLPQPVRAAPMLPAPQERTPMTIGIAAAAALTLGGAAAGAWLYARWQRERNKPINRLRRRFR
jgi:hypothetical protein